MPTPADRRPSRPKTDFDYRLPPHLFSPALAREAVRRLRDEGGLSHASKRRADELFLGAVFIHGLQLLKGEEYYLAIPVEDPPDFYASEAPGPDHPGYLTVENKSITDWDRDETSGFSVDGVAAAIDRRCRPAVFADPLMTVVVHLNFQGFLGWTPGDLHLALKRQFDTTQVENAIWILALNEDLSYAISYIYPGLGENTVTFSLAELPEFEDAEVERAVDALRDKIRRTE